MENNLKSSAIIVDSYVFQEKGDIRSIYYSIPELIPVLKPWIPENIDSGIRKNPIFCNHYLYEYFDDI